MLSDNVNQQEQQSRSSRTRQSGGGQAATGQFIHLLVPMH